MKYFGLLCYLFAINLTIIYSTANAATPRNLLQKQGNEKFVTTVLLPAEKWVPYPSYNDRKGWDNFLGAGKMQIIEQGKVQLNYQWQIVKATDYMEYSRSGSRTIMEAPYNKNINAITSLFLAEMAEGKGRFIDQLINGLFTVCEMTSWAASAHLSIQLNNKKFPDHNQQIIDLVAGDVGATFSWIYYFLHQEFDKREPLISQRIKFEINRRILEPYLTQDHFWWMAFGENANRMVNNWNPWCNSNVLQAFLLIEKDPSKLAKAVYKTMLSVDKFINYNKEDGACEEGPSYWGHAAGKLYDYLQILSDATNERISIFKEPLIRKMGEYISRSYIGNNWVVNFADASAKGGGDAPLIFRFGKAVGSKEMESFAAYLVKINKDDLSISVGRDMFRTLQSLLYNKEIVNVKPALPTALFTWYPQTEFCYMRNKTYFFAAKGGYNNESHNHNDVGSFSFYVDTVPFFIDAGVGTYTRQTFSSERYTIWTMQSDYHNLPQINGQSQQFGAEYKATQVVFSEKERNFSLDIGDAYNKNAAVKFWKRSYRLSEKGLEINDDFELTRFIQPSKLHFLVWAKPDIQQPGKVLFEKEGRTVMLNYDPQKLKASVETIPQTDLRLSKVWGKEIFRLVLTAVNPNQKDSYKIKISKM
ncbi:MAG: heparinase [Niabella sp.]|nr:MAG: heparinase [Niabella sp.]